MTKVQNKKRFKASRLSYLCIALVSLLIVAQLTSIIYILKLRQSVSSLEERYFLSSLNQVETQRYKTAPVDVSEQRIYIPDARLYIPLTDKNPEIVYDFRPNGPNLYVSIAQVVGNQRSLDDSKDHHTCDKMIVISSTEQNANAYYTFIKELPPTKDGLKYVYLHIKDNCGIYSKSGWESAKEIAENIQSY